MSRCSHKSHRFSLPCLRGETYDGYCAKHNGSCWWYCYDNHKAVDLGNGLTAVPMRRRDD